MPKALITGVSGQDGSYLAEALTVTQTEVHGVVRTAKSAERICDVLPGVIPHVGDLNDRSTISSLIHEIQPDEIYNLGGISSVAQSWNDPVSTGTSSGVAAASVLQAAWELAQTTGSQIRIVQATSAEIFGAPCLAPQDESTPVAPISPYGAAKAYAHQMVQIFRSRGLHASSLVLYNHESPRRPKHFVTRKITHSVALIAQGLATELTMGNLESRRDWGWAPDYVDAMLLAARQAVANDYVIATGRSHSVREFVEAAFARVGIQDWQRYVRIDPAFFRPVDSQELIGNAEKACRQLGWAPKVEFDEIVGRMVDADLL